MKYKIVTYQNRLNQSLFVPKKKYLLWPFWMTFTDAIDSSGTIGDVQFNSFTEAKTFIQQERDGKWYRTNNDIEVK